MKQMAKMNEAVGTKNRFTMDGRGKPLARTFKRQEFCKCFGCLILAVNYGTKGHKLWSETPKYSVKMASTEL